jgi:hypothetical protein
MLLGSLAEEAMRAASCRDLAVAGYFAPISCLAPRNKSQYYPLSLLWAYYG